MAKSFLMALGRSGVRMCEAALFGCMAGVMPAETAVMVAVGASPETLLALAADYAQVRSSMGFGVMNAFGPEVRVRAWAQEMAETSLMIRAREAEDKLLLRALFTRDEASRDTSRDMGGSGKTAAFTWAELLNREGAALEKQLSEIEAGDEVVLCGSLCEATCAAGVNALTGWMKHKYPGARVSAVLYLPVFRGDDAALCRRALQQLNEDSLRALCLVGLPEDCLLEREDGASLADWMAVRCLDGVMSGAAGGYSVRVPADKLDWDAFGGAQERYRRCYDGLVRAAWLMTAEYGQAALDKLASPNWLTDRMGWYGAHFAQVRQMDAQGREQVAGEIRAMLRLCGAYAGWMAQTLSELPLAMQWNDAMESARRESEAHYQKVVELAGQLALLESEAERGGMAEERFVHRHDMSDSAAEAMMRQIAQLREQLEEAAQEQDALDRRIGGRMQRSMLAGALRRLRQEADELRAQAQDVREKIEHSAQIASQEDMPRVAAARAKLERVERHLSALDGRAERARRDLERAGSDEIRCRLPEIEGAHDGAAQLLFTPGLLPLISQTLRAEGKARKGLAQQLEQTWMWQESVKTCMDRIAHAGSRGENSPAGRLWCAVLSATMESTEGGQSNAGRMDGRSDPTA